MFAYLILSYRPNVVIYKWKITPSIDYSDRLSIHIRAVRTIVYSLWDRLWRDGASMVVYHAGGKLLHCETLGWDGWEASKKDWEFISGRSLIWSWLRFFLYIHSCIDDGQNAANGKWTYWTYFSSVCHLDVLFQHPWRVLHWGLVPGSLQWCNWWLSCSHRTFLRDRNNRQWHLANWAIPPFLRANKDLPYYSIHHPYNLNPCDHKQVSLYIIKPLIALTLQLSIQPKSWHLNSVQ